MKKTHLLPVLLLLFFLNCNSEGVIPESYSDPGISWNDTILENIQGKISSAFLQGIVSGDPEPLGKIYDELSKVNEESPQKLIDYWLSYTDYYSSITSIQSENSESAEFLIDRGIKRMKEMKNKNSEDYALLALSQGFGIQFKGMKAMFISMQISKNLEKAKELGPDNLRAFYAAGSNDYYTPAQYGGGKKAEEYLLKALSLEDQSNPNPYLPSWGRDLAYEILLQVYIKQEKWEKAKSLYLTAHEMYPESYMINQLASKLVGK